MRGVYTMGLEEYQAIQRVCPGDTALFAAINQ